MCLILEQLLSLSTDILCISGPWAKSLKHVRMPWNEMQNWFQLVFVCCCCCLWCAHGKQAWGISENILLCVWEWPESRCYLMAEWHRAGGWRSKHILAHTPSLLFSSLVAWELAKGPQTSHQEGDKRWGGEEENRPGNILYHWGSVLANRGVFSKAQVSIRVQWVCLLVALCHKERKDREACLCESPGSKEGLFALHLKPIVYLIWTQQKNSLLPFVQQPAKQIFPLTVTLCSLHALCVCERHHDSKAGHGKNKQRKYLCKPTFEHCKKKGGPCVQTLLLHKLWILVS